MGTCFRVGVFIDDPLRLLGMVEDVVDPVDAEVLALNEGESQKLESLQKMFISDQLRPPENWLYQ